MNVPKMTPGMGSEQLEGFMSKARAASGLLKALSHETRLLILCILSQGEKTVGELEAILGLQQAVVSQQLARLRAEKIVTTRREGRLIYYNIADPSLTGLVSALYEMYCGPNAAPIIPD
ncbi:MULTISPECIES: ArsR/SmtB family transcription factor [Alphaproteobacteria]|uniref:Transcriptional regulator n=2 Tax=Alphaproteobacteria TaxID=28211 RepID=A0A512HK05_9HYPH|nr:MULTISPECIES: metalloregulator ArsR/SmtB family transcription factor [Alphaproteobacteria]GEO85765.1 transcriptional regulator [Ciceribacter naphthalenivorans]GLR21875.1 transcriptional regulator [Ciceribacter naphthalenivorans]GLT04731.1 transcriptional regulator [Sphingomonas psychrolutea]